MIGGYWQLALENVGIEQAGNLELVRLALIALDFQDIAQALVQVPTCRVRIDEHRNGSIPFCALQDEPGIVSFRVFFFLPWDIRGAEAKASPVDEGFRHSQNARLLRLVKVHAPC